MDGGRPFFFYFLRKVLIDVYFIGSCCSLGLSSPKFISIRWEKNALVYGRGLVLGISCLYEIFL